MWLFVILVAGCKSKSTPSQSKSQRCFRLLHVFFIHVIVENDDVLELVNNVSKRRSDVIDECDEVVAHGETEKFENIETCRCSLKHETRRVFI